MIVDIRRYFGNEQKRALLTVSAKRTYEQKVCILQKRPLFRFQLRDAHIPQVVLHFPPTYFILIVLFIAIAPQFVKAPHGQFGRGGAAVPSKTPFQETGNALFHITRTRFAPDFFQLFYPIDQDFHIFGNARAFAAGGVQALLQFLAFAAGDVQALLQFLAFAAGDVQALLQFLAFAAGDVQAFLQFVPYNLPLLACLRLTCLQRAQTLFHCRRSF